MSKSVKIVAVNGAEAVAPKERDGEKFGAKSGLRLTAYVNSLLSGNHAAKLGDDALQAQLAAEFPKRKALQAVSAYRGYYNAGKHGHLDPKGKRSESYGKASKEGREANVRKDDSHPLAGRSTGGAKGAKGAKGKRTAKGAKGKKGATKGATKRKAGSKVVGKKRAPRKAAATS